MTDNELKALVASLAIGQKEINKQQLKTDQQLQKTDEQLQKTDEQLQKTDAQLQKTDKKLDKIAKILGGISTNQGDITEDFFYNSLILDNRLGQLKFDDVTKNMAKHRGKIQEEYDLFLTNGDAVAIIEVKYKAHFHDIHKLERKFNNFKKLFPIYNDYKLYGAMASFYFNQETKEELLKQGYFVLERSGNLIKSENQDYLKVA